MVEKMREVGAHSSKRWASGRTTSSNQQTLCYDVAYSSGRAHDASSAGESKCTDR